jgi:molybdopterin-guanine dinucleotide biosynthesis protein A
LQAGGLGARFGGAEPKQLVPLGGRPILQHSVEGVSRQQSHHRS